ncbi:MAG: transglycosylase SLT domain-containing protein [Betaproteobacteria bacterium]
MRRCPRLPALLVPLLFAAGCAQLPQSAEQGETTIATTPPVVAPTLPPKGAAPSVPAPAPAATPVAAPPPPGDLWVRVRRGFAMPDLETKRAEQRTAWYAARPDYFDRMAQRGSLYLFYIVEEIERRGMPTELALLPFVESAMQPEAVSIAKAAGLWQFIPSTGKFYALDQNLWQDQRRDVIASTRAALDYLQKLYDEFGDWHLALAAYNMGEGGLGRAIARAQRARQPTNYASLRLPAETMDYVPKLQAIKNIVRAPQRYGIVLPEIRNEPYFVVLTKTRDIDLATLARLAEMPLDELRALNPSFNRPVIVGAAQPTILLPAAKAETYLANLAAWEATGQPLSSWTAITLAQGETIEQVARRVGVSPERLREANRIPPRYRPAAGSTLLIPRDETMDEDIAPAMLTASLQLVPLYANTRQVTYRVRQGDTIASVARRWGVSVEDIRTWNDLRSDRLFAGQRLTLTVTRQPAASTSAKASKASKPGKSAQPAKATPTAESTKPAPRATASNGARATTTGTTAAGSAGAAAATRK